MLISCNNFKKYYKKAIKARKQIHATNNKTRTQIYCIMESIGNLSSDPVDDGKQNLKVISLKLKHLNFPNEN